MYCFRLAEFDPDVERGSSAYPLLFRESAGLSGPPALKQNYQ
jgi:hypothetical protein